VTSCPCTPTQTVQDPGGRCPPLRPPQGLQRERFGSRDYDAKPGPAGHYVPVSRRLVPPSPWPGRGSRTRMVPPWAGPALPAQNHLLARHPVARRSGHGGRRASVPPDRGDECARTFGPAVAVTWNIHTSTPNEVLLRVHVPAPVSPTCSPAPSTTACASDGPLPSHLSVQLQFRASPPSFRTGLPWPPEPGRGHPLLPAQPTGSPPDAAVRFQQSIDNRRLTAHEAVNDLSSRAMLCVAVVLAPVSRVDLTTTAVHACRNVSIHRGRAQG